MERPWPARQALIGECLTVPNPLPPICLVISNTGIKISSALLLAVTDSLAWYFSVYEAHPHWLRLPVQ